MAKLKTRENKADVTKYLNTIDDFNKRKDSLNILELMKSVTKEKPKMWGDSIIGFGKYYYKYQSGREGNWFLVGFAPRKQNITIYIMTGFEGYADIMKDLGKYKTGKSCLYIKKLDDINIDVLKTLIKKSIEVMKSNYKVL